MSRSRDAVSRRRAAGVPCETRDPCAPRARERRTELEHCDGVPPDPRSAALRLHDHRRAQDRGTPSGARRRGPRLRQPGPAEPAGRGRQARRGRAELAQPPILRVARHPEAPRGRRRAVPAPVRREPRPGHGDHLDHRRQGGLQPPHVGAAAAGRRRARPHPELPDPHLGPLLRGRRRAPGPHRRRDRRRGVHRPHHRGVGARLAQAARRRAVVPAQPDDHRRDQGRPPAPRRLGAGQGRRARARPRVRRHDVRRVRAAVDHGVRGRARSRSSCTR